MFDIETGEVLFVFYASVDQEELDDRFNEIQLNYEEYYG